MVMKEKIAGRKRKTHSTASATGASGRRPTEQHEPSPQFAQANAAKVREAYEETTSTIPVLDNVLARALTLATRSAADFNLQWLEMARSNTNTAFDLARGLIGMQSAAEFLEFSVAHARKQLESFTEQAQQLATLAQKGAADSAESAAADLTSTFTKVARSNQRA
jgi:hypothetical protein